MWTSRARKKGMKNWSIMNTSKKSRDVVKNSVWRKNSSNNKNKARAQIGTPITSRAKRLTNKMKMLKPMINSPTTISTRNTHLKKWTPSRKGWTRKANQLMRKRAINSNNNPKRSVRRAVGKARQKILKRNHRTRASRNKRSQKERAVPPNSRDLLTAAET